MLKEPNKVKKSLKAQGVNLKVLATKSLKPNKLSNLNFLGKLTNMEIGFDDKPQDVNNLLGKDLPNLQGANTNAFMILICVGLNTILTQLVSNIFSTYFYDTKVVQTLYSTSHNLNTMTNGFIFQFQNILNLFSYVHIKNCSIF